MNPPSSWAFIRTSSKEDPAGTEMECLYGGQTLGTFSITWMNSGTCIGEGVTVAGSNVTVPGREEVSAGVRAGGPGCEFSFLPLKTLGPTRTSSFLMVPSPSTPPPPAQLKPSCHPSPHVPSHPRSGPSRVSLPPTSPLPPIRGLFLESAFAQMAPLSSLRVSSPLHSPACHSSPFSQALLFTPIPVFTPLCLCSCCLFSALPFPFATCKSHSPTQVPLPGEALTRAAHWDSLSMYIKA